MSWNHFQKHIVSDQRMIEIRIKRDHLDVSIQPFIFDKINQDCEDQAFWNKLRLKCPRLLCSVWCQSQISVRSLKGHCHGQQSENETNRNHLILNWWVDQCRSIQWLSNGFNIIIRLSYESSCPSVCLGWTIRLTQFLFWLPSRSNNVKRDNWTLTRCISIWSVAPNKNREKNIILQFLTVQTDQPIQQNIMCNVY
jgi:hypothetical protein